MTRYGAPLDYHAAAMPCSRILINALVLRTSHFDLFSLVPAADICRAISLAAYLFHDSDEAASDFAPFSDAHFHAANSTSAIYCYRFAARPRRRAAERVGRAMSGSLEGIVFATSRYCLSRASCWVSLRMWVSLLASTAGLQDSTPLFDLFISR